MDSKLEVILAAKDMSKKTMTAFKKRMDSVTKSVFSLQGGLVALAGGFGFQKVVTSLWDVAAGFEQMGATLDVLTEGKGEETLEEINAIALDLPISTSEAVKGFTTMTALGLDPTVKELRTMIDVASILGDDVIPRLSMQLGQAATKGKIQAQDINVLGEAGIKATKYLKDAFGMTVTELQTSGISIRKQIDAIFAGMAEDYEGAAERMKMSGKGLVATFKSYATEISRQTMEAGIYEEIKIGISGINDEMADWLQNNSGMLKQEIPKYIDNVKTSVKGLYDLYQSVDGVVGIAAYGLIGKFFFGNAGFAAMAGFKVGDYLADQIYQVDTVAEELTKRADILSASIAEMDRSNQPGKAGILERWNTTLDLINAKLAIIRKESERIDTLSVDMQKIAPISNVPVENLYTYQPTQLDAHVKKFEEDLTAAQVGTAEAWGAYLDEDLDLLVPYWERMEELSEGTVKITYGAATEVDSIWASTFDSMGDAFSGWATGYSYELTNMIWESELSFKAVAKSFGKMLTQMGIQMAMSTAFKLFSAGFGGGMNTGKPAHLGAGLTSAFSMAGGGFIGEDVIGIGRSTGSSYEFHANEIIAPTSKIGSGGGSNVNVTINAVDASSVQELLTKNRGLISGLIAGDAMNNGGLRTAIKMAVQ